MCNTTMCTNVAVGEETLLEGVAEVIIVLSGMNELRPPRSNQILLYNGCI